VPEMTFRERFVRTFHYQPVDRLPDMEFGYWDENYAIWHRQGMPTSVCNETSAYNYFSVDPDDRWWLPGAIDMIPAFETEVLEETPTHKIIRNSSGTICEIPKDGHSTIPRFIEFAVKNRADFEKMKERYDPADPRRYPNPEGLARLREQYARGNAIRGCWCNGFYGWARDWIGVENLSVLFYDDPDLIADMFNWIADFVIEVHERGVQRLGIPDLKIDTTSFWEDMAFRGGPLISPAMFRKFQLPCYKRVTTWLRDRVGCDLNYVDCDGDITALAGLFFEGGVNIMFPLEIGGGTDPYLLRKTYGKDMLFLGGVNKRELMKDHAAIDAEIERIRPLIEDGGYIPHVDHRCPPDVSLDNYKYYRQQKQKLLGKIK